MSCGGGHLEFSIGIKKTRNLFSTNFTFFSSDMKFKMAATAGLSLTLDLMGKMFQDASPLKPNCPGMIIGRSSTKYQKT
jgi:hypothetical protein